MQPSNSITAVNQLYSGSVARLAIKILLAIMIFFRIMRVDFMVLERLWTFLNDGISQLSSIREPIFASLALIM